MSDFTTNLQMPFILPDQAQKHVTHNEALQRLDSLVHLSILDTLATPPATPALGSLYLVATGGTGAWLGHDGDLALYQDGEWLFARAQRGWLAWQENPGRYAFYDGTAWTDYKLPSSGRMDLLGINSAPDTQNRLSVNAASSLFTGGTASHQLKVNKGTDASTGSLLLQNNYVGRAEIGLLGDNDLTVKVSPDGAAWNIGLGIDSGGVPRMPNRPVCRAALNAAALTPAASSYTGFQAFSVNQGKFTLGAAVSPGTGQKLTVPSTGLYLLYLNVIALTSSGHAVALMRNTTTLMTVKGTANTINVNMSGMTIASLTANDAIQLQHTGTAQIDFGAGKTELMMMML